MPREHRLRMRRSLAVAAALASALFGSSVGAAAVAAPAHAQSTAKPAATKSAATVTPNGGGKTGVATKRLCTDTSAPGFAHCMSLLRTDIVRHHVGANDTPSGFGPADLQSAYNLPSSSAGAGQTVGIVDAFDDPNAEADLAVYRAQYGLPPCTTDNGCFSKVDQRGGTDYPTPDSGWAGEISLDLDMVSAACPDCHIVLVESDDNSLENLGAAVNEAVALGAKYVSNSYGGSEDGTETSWDTSYYQHPGVVVTASTGDYGYGTAYPAASPWVTAVGGTSLTKDSSTRGWSETAWDGAGSGCSLYEAKPAFQTDTGCANRSEADVSAVADPVTGVAVYDTFQTSGWQVFGGTSVSSPLIASVYALAGAPVAGSYPNSYPYSTTSALNDVTSGSNGSCDPAYLCTSGPGYDGPTGLGTPNGVRAFQVPGPHGTLVGRVTDADTGQGIRNATVTAGVGTTMTDDHGNYVLSLGTGSYDVTAKAFDYAAQHTSSVVITKNRRTTQNFALHAVPMVSLTGTVRDGSGHGWPLYSVITVDGVPDGTVYSSPVTGAYSINLPQKQSYTIHVRPMAPGYQDVSRSVWVGTSDRSISVKVPVVSDCIAAGYQIHYNGSTQTFDDTTAPPHGWTVVNASSDGGWVFDDPGGRTNLTGGTGGFAIADSDHAGIGTHLDTQLITPRLDFTGMSDPVVQFNQAYRPLGSTSTVDVSTDGGTTWTTVLDQSNTDIEGPAQTIVDLSSVADTKNVLVRFHYIGDWAWFWEVDNVFLGERTCTPVHGGIVTGFVQDKVMGGQLVGAKVANASDSSIATTTVTTPDDVNLKDGFYWLFSPKTGTQHMTASDGKYTPQTKTVDIRPNSVVQSNFRLGAGHLTVTNTSIDSTVKMGKQGSGSFTLHNDGTAAVQVQLQERPGSFAPMLAQRGAPLQRVSGHFSPLSLAKAGKAGMGAHPTRPTGSPSDAPWVNIADYPIPVMDNAAVWGDGLMYSIGGVDGTSGNTTGAGYVFDPSTGAWTATAADPTAREEPTAAYLDGKVYVTGGWGSDGNPVAGTDVYDPSSDSWTTAAADPAPHSGASSAVLNGKWYVVGGCDASTCGSTDVEVYDPTADSWAAAASYPEPVSWEGCGAVAGNLVCAGGTTDAGTTVHGYSYDAGSDSWSSIADMPMDLWAMGYTGANGNLLLSGGVTNGTATLTNQGLSYDPASDSWSALPNSNNTVYRGGSTCGFYRVGGSTGGFSPSAGSEQLPGFDQCGTAPDVTWLGESPTSLTLQPGDSATVHVTLDAGDASITQPGGYSAQIAIATDTPYSMTPVAVTMHVTPPASWGKLTGTVVGKTCPSGATAPLAGAVVQVSTWAAHYTLKTGADGTYQLWLDQRNNPLTLIVAKDGYQPQTQKVRVKGGQVTTVDWTLLKIGC